MIHLPLSKWPWFGHLPTVYPTLICLCWFVYGIYICQSSSVRRNFFKYHTLTNHVYTAVGSIRANQKSSSWPFLFVLDCFSVILYQVAGQIQSEKYHSPHPPGPWYDRSCAGNDCAGRYARPYCLRPHLAHGIFPSFPCGQCSWRPASFNNRSLFASQLCHPSV